MCPKLARPSWVQWVKSGSYRQSAELLAAVQDDASDVKKKELRNHYRRLTKAIKGERTRNQRHTPRLSTA
jgi:hypothetical protein